MFASYFAKRSLGVSKAGECRKLTRWEGLLIEFWASSLWRVELPSVLRENDPCSLKQNKTKKSLWSLSNPVSPQGQSVDVVTQLPKTVPSRLISL